MFQYIEKSNKFFYTKKALVIINSHDEADEKENNLKEVTLGSSNAKYHRYYYFLGLS